MFISVICYLAQDKACVTFSKWKRKHIACNSFPWHHTYIYILLSFILYRHNFFSSFLFLLLFAFVSLLFAFEYSSSDSRSNFLSFVPLTVRSIFFFSILSSLEQWSINNLQKWWCTIKARKKKWTFSIAIVQMKYLLYQPIIHSRFPFNFLPVSLCLHTLFSFRFYLLLKFNLCTKHKKKIYYLIVFSRINILIE